MFGTSGVILLAGNIEGKIGTDWEPSAHSRLQPHNLAAKFSFFLLATSGRHQEFPVS